ncbi:S-adenosyl-L-methionine-dependent methyltransferase [Cladochytrium replicatum]|nr:S-adenosyl-L-methionine-dependent methyltransferase [Cladochytrium replicatum]
MGTICSKDTEPVIARAAVNTQAAATWVGNEADAQDGRTFHEAVAPYVLPNDIKEGSRLNLQHHLIRQLYGGPNYAGVSEADLRKGINVLDVGCGTGIWLAEMNRDFPSGRYFGVDITSTAWAETFQEIAGPNEINLVQANVMERLPFDDNTFDYVHQQLLVFGVPDAKWPGVIAELHRVLKPGGILHLVEITTLFSNYGTPSQLEKDMRRLSTGLFQARGFNVNIAQELPGFVRNHGGFDKISVAPKEVPCGWGGEIGQLWMMDMSKALVSLKPFMAPALGIPLEQWDPTMETFIENAGNNKAFINVVQVTAAKQR